MLFNLSNFLERFKGLKDPKENKTIISGIILDTAGVTIDEGCISIQKNMIYISSSSLFKSRIYMKKTGIVASINAAIPGLDIKDIV